MKIGVCLIGDMVFANRDWNRTMTGFFDTLINCWKENDEVYLYICSNYIPKHVLDFFKPKKHIIHGEQMKQKYVIMLENIIDDDLDFIICTRPDIVFLKNVSSFNMDFDSFNFLHRECGRWDQYFTCDNFYALNKRFFNQFYEVLVNCEKVPPFTGELHSQIYPCLVDKIGKNNIHFIERMGFSSHSPYYLIDRYIEIPGDMGPTTIDDYKKCYIKKEGDFFSIQRKNLTTLKEFINLHEERYLTFEKEYSRLDMW